METFANNKLNDEWSESGLTFVPEIVLPPSEPKPTGRVRNILSTYMPGLFDVSGETSGLQTASIHFASGTMYGTPPDSVRYLHARSTGNITPISKTGGVAIVSGVCLFGEAGLKCYGPDGVPAVLERPGVSAADDLPQVVDVQKGKIQLYVPESIARLGRTIGALAQVAASEYDKPSKVYIHLPGPEYKIRAEVAYASGKIALDALHKYYGMVDKEVAEVVGQFTTALNGIDFTTVEFGSPLDAVVHDIEPGSLTIGDFKGTLFENLVSDTASMRYVEHASEVAAYLDAANSGSLPVFVDNHAQEKIFKKAKKAPGFNGIALYPLPLCVSKQTKNLLYHSGASPEEIQQAIAPWMQN